MMGNLGIRCTAGALAVGLALAGPVTGLAVADSPEGGASAASTDSRGGATRPSTSREGNPARESRADRMPRAAGAEAGSRAERVRQARVAETPTAAEATTPDTAAAASDPTGSAAPPVLDLADPSPGVSGDGAAPQSPADPVDVAAVDVRGVTDPGTPDGPGWAYQTSVPGDLAGPAAPAAPAAHARAVRVPTTSLTTPPAGLAEGVAQFLDGVIDWLSTLPANPVTELLEGALLLVRRALLPLPTCPAAAASGGGSTCGGTSLIVIPELDSLSSPLAVRVDQTQPSADGIKVRVSAKPFSLTLPAPVSNYTVLANKPELVTISASGNQLNITATTPGFLGLAITPKDGTAARYLGLYIGDQTTGIVPDVTTVNGKPPVGTVALTNGDGDKFLEEFNYRAGVAPIDYLYIYDQGGADYTDGNLTGLLTQAVRHGMVPVVVYYNIQAVDKGTSGSSTKTGIVEGYNTAYQAVNEYNWSGSRQTDPTMFTGYMTRYFQKLGKDFAVMDRVGVPVQVVMEPDFLGYMAVNQPDFAPPYPFVPNTADRSLNTAKVNQPMRDAGLLSAADPTFADTIAGMVQAINYYAGKTTTNLRMGWKTNIWSVADQKVNSLGLLHVTDETCTQAQCDYPWQYGWVKPVGWDEGRTYIEGQATQLGAFLKKVGVTSWTNGKPERAPFVAIDKYGVDGAYTYDPTMLTKDSTSAAFGDLGFLIFAAYSNCPTSPCQDPSTFGFTDAAVQKYFGLADRAAFKAFYDKYATTGYDKNAPDVQAVFTTLQNAAKADPNIAKWFFNADHWSNYLFFVNNLSTAMGGTKVMLWQIPQGHINGSAAGRDLTNTDAYYEDSATSFFFGDTFTPTGQYAAERLKHFGADDAPDTSVTVTGDTITWGEHMTLAGKSGALSVLFGAGLGLSTRGSPTPAGNTTDQGFWFDKATAYLTRG